MKVSAILCFFMMSFAVAQETLVLDDFIGTQGDACEQPAEWIDVPSNLFDARIRTGTDRGQEGFCVQVFPGFLNFAYSYGPRLYRFWNFNTPQDFSGATSIDYDFYTNGDIPGWSWVVQDANGNSDRVFFDRTAGTIPLTHAVDFSQVTSMGFEFIGGESDAFIIHNLVITFGAADTDGDGVSDDVDACADSDLAATVVINGCDTGVTNWVNAEGCSLADQIAELGSDNPTAWQFQDRLGRKTQEWVNAGEMTAAERSDIMSCAWEWCKPNANDDSGFETDSSTALFVAAPGVLANDSDPQGNSLEAHLVSGPAAGSLSLNRDGSFTYVPAPGVTGPQTFTYRAWDGGCYREATATIEVSMGNQLPVATDDSANIAINTRTTFDAPGVLGNDYDPEGAPLIAHLTTTTSKGMLGFHQDGSFWYEPNTDFVGTDSFTYKITDGQDAAFATVTLIVGN